MVEVLYSEFLRQVDAGEVAAVSFSDNPALGFRRVGSDPKEMFSTVAVAGAREALISKLSEKGVTFGQVATGGLKRFSSVFILMIPFLYLAAMAYVLTRLHSPKGEAGRRASTGDRSEVTFADVAGSDEAKVELEEIVDIFHNPERYGTLGARMPRGVLLVGPPGTGKTLLAKAVAGECAVPFFYASASDFVEVLVGRGAARVRDLFARARREAPCIVFIDELDAVAKARRNAFGGGCEEREQTLDAMLAEMDGFMHGSRDAAGTSGACAPVVVIAATNRAEVLDKAILRPGRFDRLVQVALPNVTGRLAILQLHAERIGNRLNSDVDLAQVAALARGLSGAELANVVNEAALLAARAGCNMVRHDHFAQAILRVAKQHMQSTTAEGVQMGAPSSPPINLLLPN